MKKFILLYALLFPFLSICQTDSLSFAITIQKDSTLNFLTDNLEFYHYLENEIDHTLDRGFFPREKVIARCLLSENGIVDSIIVVSLQDHFKLEVSSALKSIERFNLPKQYTKGQIELALIFRRWREIGEFEVQGRIIDYNN